MSYDVNKIIEESVANIMDEPDDANVLQEGVETKAPETKDGEREELISESDFEASRKFLMESAGVPEGKKE